MRARLIYAAGRVARWVDNWCTERAGAANVGSGGIPAHLALQLGDDGGSIEDLYFELALD
jgi:hypothetical protein